MIISYIDEVEDKTISASSADGDFPIGNVQHPHLSNKWRSTGDTSEWIKIDMATAVDPGSAFLGGTNLTDSATVKIQGNATDVWTSPTVDITMSKEDDIFYSYSTDFAELRWWRFVIEDPTNPDGYISVGRAWIGETITLLGPHTSFIHQRINTSVGETSISGQSYGDTGYVYNSWEMSFPYWNNEEKNNIITFSDTVNKSKQFFVQFADDNDNQLGPIYCIMTNNIDFVHLKTLNVWSSTIVFRETY